MPYQLVYLPKSGNKNYWTTNSNFTHKPANHLSWDNLAQLIADFPVLKAQYPTIFNNRRDDRFYVYDDDGKMVGNLIEKLDTLSAEHPQSAWQLSTIKYPPKAHYAIRATVAEQEYYYNSSKGKNGSFISPGEGEIRFWKQQELDKATATAQNLCRNKNFLQKLPGLLPEHLVVINVRTNQIVWSPQQLAPVQKAKQVTPSNNLLERVKIQLNEHFTQSDQGVILNDQAEQQEALTIDLERYSAPQVFAALCYLLEALGQRTAVNKLLDTYDQAILQDFLHTVELADIQQLDGAAFVKSFQQIRQERRKIKDLSILLNTIGDNIDQASILKQLLNHQSLHNQYHYRNPVSYTHLTLPTICSV